MIPYTFPDETAAPCRPIDGEIFCEHRKDGRATRVWQWDDFKEQWFDVTVSGAEEDDLLKAFDMLISEGIPKCDCGSDSVGSPKHSTWCSVYVKDL